MARLLVPIALALAAGSFGSFAQDTSSDRVFAPFVSRLAVVDREGRAALSWIDSRDATGPVFVFRAAATIDADNLSKAEQVAEVPYGAQSYIDKPPRPGSWSYFVAASDEAGTRYQLCLPYTNVADAEIVEPDAPALAEKPAPAPAAPGEALPRVSAVAAAVSDDSVRISFRADASVANVLVYRSASRIERTSDLLDAVIVQSAPASAVPVVDYPVPGIPYFYALIPDDELRTGQVGIERGVNATIVPVEVPAGLYRIGLPGPPRDIRSMPLPLLTLGSGDSNSMLGAPPPAVPAQLSAAASKAVATLLAGAAERKLPERKPRAFPQDLETPAGGEEYVLRSIVQGPFAKKNWEESARQIARYLSLSRTPKSEARARYYLGQAYYFSGKHPEALFEFLLAQSQYYAESQEWINAILPRLGGTEAVSAGS